MCEREGRIITAEERARWISQGAPDALDGLTGRIKTAIEAAEEAVRKQQVVASPEMEEEARQRLQTILKEIVSAGHDRPDTIADRRLWPESKVKRILEALFTFLSLHPQERSFIRDLAENCLDGDTAGVFADWLEDNGRTESGERVRLLRTQPGDVVVLICQPSRLYWDAGDREAEDALKKLHEVMPGVHLMAVDSGFDLRHASVADMRKMGWVRAEGGKK